MRNRSLRQTRRVSLVCFPPSITNPNYSRSFRTLLFNSFDVRVLICTPRRLSDLFLSMRDQDRGLPATFPLPQPPPRRRRRFISHFISRFISSWRINGHYTLILQVDRISPLIAKTATCWVSILTSWNCSPYVWSDVTRVIATLAFSTGPRNPGYPRLLRSISNVCVWKILTLGRCVRHCVRGEISF